jgi:hypothetical protein
MTTRGNGETRPAFMWTLPVCPHQVAVELEVIRTLQQALADGTEPQQGLLFGRKMSGVTCVQAIQPLPALEERVFTEALNQAWWPVAGFYRIREGHAFVLEPGETDLATSLFRQPGSVILLIERRETGPAEGAFAFWRGGTLVSNLPRPFPIDAAALTGDEQPAFTKALAPAASSGGTFLSRASQAGVLGAALLVLLTLQFAWRKKPPASPDPPVRVRSVSPALANASRSRSDLEIVWQVDSLSDATTGLLNIRDGAVQHRVPLDRGRLYEGRLIYSSGDGPVSVEMAALRSDGRIVAVPVSARLLSDPLLPFPHAASQSSPLPPERSEPPVPEVRERVQPATASVHEPARRQRFALAAAPARSALNPPLLPDPPSVQPLAAVASPLAAVPSQPALPLPAAPPVAPVPASVVSVVSPPDRGAPPPAEAKRGSGRLIWTGTLLRRGVVEFDGQSVSVGTLSGTLPGLPISFTVSPAEFSGDGLVVYTADPARNNQVEPPSAHNGWNRLKFVWDPDRVHEITVLESPNASNRFSHLALRADARRCFMLLIDWKTR